MSADNLATRNNTCLRGAVAIAKQHNIPASNPASALYSPTNICLSNTLSCDLKFTSAQWHGMTNSFAHTLTPTHPVSFVTCALSTNSPTHSYYNPHPTPPDRYMHVGVARLCVKVCAVCHQGQAGHGTANSFLTRRARLY